MEKREDPSVKVYLNGLGLGSIAAAMYLIQKADFLIHPISIFLSKRATRILLEEAVMPQR